MESKLKAKMMKKKKDVGKMVWVEIEIERRRNFEIQVWIVSKSMMRKYLF